MRTLILGTAVVMALVAVGCGDDDDTADDDNDGGGDSGNGGKNGGGSGSSANRNDGGPNGGGSGTGVVVGDGTQFTGCTANTDCDPGLSCYTFGGYCSAQCSGDADCSSLGANAGCYQAAGGGMMGGFFGGAGGATGSGGSSGSTTTGTCRVSCTGVDDTSCPTGLMCIDVGAGSFRCALPGAGTMGGSGGAGGIFGGAGGAGFFGGSGGLGGNMQTPGDTEAFDECMGGGCVEGLTCSSGFGRGFCTQTCQNTSDCTNEPGSGDATPTCGRNGRCILECTVDSDECPDGMTCTRQGGGFPGNNNGEDAGGAPVAGRCNYSN